jgi:hypothetical protein
VQIHVEPSELACPWSTTPEKMQAVRLSLLEEAARRFGCKLDQVQTMRLADFRAIADPHLKHRDHWAGRTKIRHRSR